MTYRPYPTREEWEADAAGFASFLRQDETPDARLADYAPTDPDSIFGKTPMEIFALNLRSARTELSRLIKAVEAGEATFRQWRSAEFDIPAQLRMARPWYEAWQADVAEREAEDTRQAVEYRRTDEAWAKELQRRDQVKAWSAGLQEIS